MQDLLLLAAIIVMFVFGWFWMDRLERFFQDCFFIPFIK